MVRVCGGDTCPADGHADGTGGGQWSTVHRLGVASLLLPVWQWSAEANAVFMVDSSFLFLRGSNIVLEWAYYSYFIM